MKILFAEDDTAVIGSYTKELTAMGFQTARKMLPSKIGVAGVVYKTMIHDKDGLEFHFVRSTKALDSVIPAEEFDVVLMDNFLDDDKSSTSEHTAYLTHLELPPYVILIGNEPHKQVRCVQKITANLSNLLEKNRAEVSGKEFLRNWGIIRQLQNKEERSVIIKTYGHSHSNISHLHF